MQDVNSAMCSTPSEDPCNDYWEKKTLRTELEENVIKAEKNLQLCKDRLKNCPQFLLDTNRKQLGLIGLYF